MDVGALAGEVVTAIQPYLAQLAGRVADAAIDDVGDAAWQRAKQLWQRLRGQEEPPKALEAAVEQAAQNPDDPDALEVLQLQVKMALRVDLGLAEVIETLLREAGPRVEVHGGQAVVVQGNCAKVVLGDEHHHHAGAAEPDLEPLRHAYLNRLLTHARRLALAGVDPAVATAEAETRLDLDAVYVGLLTTQTDQERDEQRLRPERSRSLSAVELLDRHQHLVLLGDPGSGKSTFVAFVALCLAGESLGREDVNLGVLTTPLLRGEREDEDKIPQPWSHGPLLPVRVVLRDLAARVLPEPGEPATAAHLWQFVEQELAAAGHEELLPALKKELLERGGLVLLDGLDEVPGALRRRTQVCQMVEDFVAANPQCRVVVTCRTYAYQHQQWRLSGL